MRPFFDRDRHRKSPVSKRRTDRKSGTYKLLVLSSDAPITKLYGRPLPMPDDRQVRRLKLRELRVLLAVTQAGSMAKAAKQLAISQPAVSRAIADMEQTLGVPLFDRTAQGIEPTRYGRALLTRSVAVFDELT